MSHEAAALALAIGFPVALLVLNELIARGGSLRPTLRALRNVLLPILGGALLIRYVLGWAGQTADQVAQTALWIAVLYVSLGLLNDVLFGAAQGGTWRANIPELLRSIVRSLLVGVGGALIYSQIWGKELAGAIAALGVGSLVLGLALQEPLGNVFSGIMLLFERPIALDDWIQVDSHSGRVVSQNWRAVNLETATQDLIVVPNSSLYKTSFVNHSRPTPLRTEVQEFGFGYEDPPNKVKAVLMELARETPGVLASPAPVVRTVGFGDYSVNYELRFSVENTEAGRIVRDELLTRAWYAVQRGGLTIPYPIAVEVADDMRELKRRQTLDPAALLAAYPRFQTARSGRAQILRYATGEYLLRDGSDQDGLGLLVEGEASLLARDASGAEEAVGRLRPGDFYGEHSVLAGEASRLAVRALADTLVVLFDLETTRELAERSPQLAREIGETIDQRRRVWLRARQAGSGSV